MKKSQHKLEVQASVALYVLYAYNVSPYVPQHPPSRNEFTL